jgi:hypothetical protein
MIKEKELFLTKTYTKNNLDYIKVSEKFINIENIILIW